MAGFRLTPIAYEQLTSVSSATGLTTATYKNANLALISCESQNVRWRDDGTNPSASVGKQLLTGIEFAYDGDLSKIKFIEEAASAKVNVAYYFTG